ncbi:MAG TPA: hypothetical protein VN747_00825 [Burkholderiales bacterium]|nr:hypothetical protein [Burkholderiales bacterium]
MRLIRIVGLALAATALLAAAASATATAEVPEFGRCVPAEGKTGEFTGASCTRPAAGKGKFNWVPGPGPKPKFEGTSESVPLLQMGSLTISCAAATFNGEYTGAKTASVTVDLIGCLNTATNRECQTNPLKEGEIEPPGALEGEIGFVNINGLRKVGLDLKRSPVITTFTCGNVGEIPQEVNGTLEGSVIGQIAPPNYMREIFKLRYKVEGGKQVPEAFEGGEKDTLTANLVSGTSTSTVPATLKIKLVELVNEEPFEIKAR